MVYNPMRLPRKSPPDNKDHWQQLLQTIIEEQENAPDAIISFRQNLKLIIKEDFETLHTGHISGPIPIEYEDSKIKAARLEQTPDGYAIVLYI